MGGVAYGWENGAVPPTYDEIPRRSHSETLIDWMVFDLGNVVLHQRDMFPAIAKRIGADPALPTTDFRAAYDAPRHDYDLHSDPELYWSAVASSCGAPPPDATAVAELTDLDVELWSQTDPAILDLFAELRSAGIRLAVLSNAPVALGEFVRRQSWSALFEKIVISGEIGHVKPDPAIYRYLLGELGAPGPRVAFTDDLSQNIASANEAGIRGLLYRGEHELRTDLAGLGVVVESR